MTNTSRRLRALAGRLCEFEEADLLVDDLLLDARCNKFWFVEDYMDRANWTGPLAKWRKTVREELESIYADHQARQAD